MSELINVRLYGELGKEFGKEWKIACTSPREALAVIQANTQRLMTWLRNNKEKFAHYKILVKYRNGKKEYLTQDTYLTANNIISVSFTPVVSGSGNVAKTVVGVVLMVASYWCGPAAPYVFQVGLALTIGGVTGLLAGKQKSGNNSGSSNTSHYFQGVGKNQTQGNPVPLIYGQCKIDPQMLSVAITVDNDALDTSSTSKKSTKGKS